MEPTAFGTLSSGQSAELFTLRNAHGIEVQLTNYGGIITSLKTPDRAGHFSDIVLGYDNLAGYVANSPYFGALVGRYANRIARGHFTLDGTAYTLAVNMSHSLHGDARLRKVVWTPGRFRIRKEASLSTTRAGWRAGYQHAAHNLTYTLTGAID